jgi:4-hydroxyproline epimerase
MVMTAGGLRRLRVVDSHTGGEPTRIVIDGGPELTGTAAQRRDQLKNEHDWLRRATILEPRGSEVLVGGLLLPPQDAAETAGVIFFNNVGYLGMCGHGTIGLVTTLAYLNRMPPGPCRIGTPAGSVLVERGADGRVAVENVAAFRYRAHVPVEVPGYGTCHGDIAYGGNWFFICEDHGQTLEFARIERLTEYTTALRRALRAGDISGKDGAEIDHIELVAHSKVADAQNFVLCPGGAYDRSPCGTGTCAKLACLAADGRLEPEVIWRQQSITGSVFEASYVKHDGKIIPTIRGEAFITADAMLIIDAADPLRYGLQTP